MSGNDEGREDGLEFLGRRPAVRRQREPIVVVALLPPREWTFGIVLCVEVMATPELLVIDAMAPFDLAILLRAPRFDVAMTNAGRFDRQLERERELAAVVALQLLTANGGVRRSSPRECRLEC